MFQKPRSAKRMYFDVIPRAVDEYLQFIAAYPNQEGKAQIENPAWHIHAGHPPQAELPITFALLLNLVSVSNAEDKTHLWGFIRKYQPDATPEKFPLLDQLAGYAVAYFHAFEKPKKTYRAATEQERVALEALSAALADVADGAKSDELQNLVYEAGKANGFAENLRDWFKGIYEVLLGSSQGPRFGGFIELYGVKETRELIAKALAGAFVKGA
jgi:lysyl-tRNA synthetase, class I